MVQHQHQQQHQLVHNIMIILIFAFGLIIGSFLNVCIYRIPRHESIVFGRSHCTKCGKQIKWYDLVPVFSYLFLFGKCRNCKEKISIIYIDFGDFDDKKIHDYYIICIFHDFCSFC